MFIGKRKNNPECYFYAQLPGEVGVPGFVVSPDYNLNQRIVKFDCVNDLNSEGKIRVDLIQDVVRELNRLFFGVKKTDWLSEVFLVEVEEVSELEAKLKIKRMLKID